MEKIIDFIIEFTKKLPITLQGLILLVLSSGFVFYKLFNNEKFRNMVFKRLAKRMNKITKMSLYTSQIFYRKEYFLQKIETIRFDDPYKTEVFKIILKAKLETDIRCITEFLDKGEYIDVSKEGLSTLLNSNVSRIIKAYDDEALKRLIKAFGEEKGVHLFDFVMSSEKGFRIWRYDRIEYLYSKINDVICTNRIYDNNLERVESYLVELQYALKEAVFSAEKTFESFNGEIKNIIKGENLKTTKNE